MPIKRIPMAPERRVPPPADAQRITVDMAMRSPAVADLLKGIPVLSPAHVHSWQHREAQQQLLTAEHAVDLAQALGKHRKDYEDDLEIKVRIRREAADLHTEHPELEIEDLVDLIPAEEWRARPVTRGQLSTRDLWHEAAGWIATGRRRDEFGTWEEFEEYRAFFEPGRDCYFVDQPEHPLGGYWLFTLAAICRRIGERLRRDGRPRAHWAGWPIWARIHEIRVEDLTPVQREQSQAKWREDLRREAEAFSKRGRDASYRLPKITEAYELAKFLLEVKRLQAREKAKAEKAAEAAKAAQARATHAPMPYQPPGSPVPWGQDASGSGKVVPLRRTRR